MRGLRLSLLGSVATLCVAAPAAAQTGQQTGTPTGDNIVLDPVVDGAEVDALSGDDTVTGSGTVIGQANDATVRGGDGLDLITLTNGATLGADAGVTGQVLGEAGDDEISLEATTIGLNGIGLVSGGIGADRIETTNGSVLGAELGAIGTIAGDGGDDAIDLMSTAVGDRGDGVVSGGDGADTITLGDGTSLGQDASGTGTVRGDGGNDTISMTGGAVGGYGTGTISGGEGADAISLTGTSLGDGNSSASGQVLGDAGDDTITLQDGFVGRYGAGVVSGGEGDDTISLDGTSMGSGSASASGAVRGDGGDDTISLSGVAVGRYGTASVSGGEGNDSIVLTNGTSVNGQSIVTGDAGDDTVSIDGSVRLDAGSIVDGGADRDTLVLLVGDGETATDLPTGQFLNFEVFGKGGAGALEVTTAGFASAYEEFSVLDGLVSVTGNGSLAASIISVEDGTLQTDGGGLASDAALTVSADGTVDLTGDEAVASVVSGGQFTTDARLTTANGFTNQAGGVLTTTDTLNGNLANEGVVEAGGTISGAVVNDGQFDVIAALIVENTITNNEDGTLAVSDGDLTGITALVTDGQVEVGTGRLLEADSVSVTGGGFSNRGIVESDVTVEGGVLSGTGLFRGDVTVADGGTLAPGEGVGTLQVSGALAFEAGSALEIDVAEGGADRIDVTGTVAIDGGTLTVSDLTGATALRDDQATLVIISNDGTDAVSGDGFTTVIDDLAFIDPFVDYGGGDGNDVALTFVMPIEIDLTDAATTANQNAVGAAFNDVLTGDGPPEERQELFDAFVLLNNEEAGDGLDDLAGGLHPTTTFEMGSLTLSNAREHLRLVRLDGDGGRAARYRLFGSAAFRRVEVDGDGNGIGMTSDASSLVVGADAALTDSLRLGLAFGAAGGEIDSEPSGQTAETGAVTVSASLSGLSGPMRFALVGGYSAGDADTTRRLAIGDFDETATATYDMTARHVLAEVGVAAELGRADLTPFAQLGFVSVTRDAFSEAGAGLASLSGDEGDETYGVGEAGLRIGTAFESGGMTLRPVGSVSYMGGGGTPTATLRFSEPQTDFAVSGAERGGGRFRAVAGLEGSGEGGAGYLRYEGIYSGSETAHVLAFGGKLAF